MIATTQQTPVTNDRITQLYNDACASADSPLAAIMDHVQRHPSLAKWSGSYLPRPLFVDKQEIESFADDVLRMFDLVTALPDRLFDGDLDRYCAALAIDERRARLIRRLGGGAPPRYGRADMYHDGTSFKLLEMGIASEVGGADRAGEIPRALLDADAFASFASEHGLGYVRTGRRVAQALRSAAVTVTDGDPVVALLEGPGGLANYASHWNTFRDVMHECELDFHVAEVGDVSERNGKLCLGTRAIDVILRCFTVEEIMEDPHGTELVEPIFRAHEEGRVVLFTPMESNLFANKGCLALLSDPCHRNALSADESALVDRVLPWTRALKATSCLADADVDYCHERRETLILKPNAFYGGIGVIAGWEKTDNEWWRALKDGASAGCIVQERVIPRLEPIVDPVTKAEEPWQAAWGLFYTPSGYAGAYARAVPAFESAVIGVTAYKNTRTAGVLHYEGADSERDGSPTSAWPRGQ